MIACHGHKAGVFGDLHQLNVAEIAGRGQKQNVEFTGGGFVQQSGRLVLSHVELERGQYRAEMGQQRGQQVWAAGRDDAESERSGQRRLRVAGEADEFLGVKQQALGAGGDLFSQGVSMTERWVRSNRTTPNRASRSSMPPLRVDWVTAQYSAALPK
jgi:hypothetical protein